jgi:hypothetical protein
MIKFSKLVLAVNPFINWPPTKLRREMNKATGEKKKLLAEALEAWTVAQQYDRLQSVGRVGWRVL